MKKKIKVLYVEDNPLDADLLVSYFKEEADEFSITVVETGTACKRILGTDKFDLILLDNKLPDMNGIDILRELVITMKDVPKVLMTGTGCEELVIQALRIGAADYVVKNGDYVEKLPFVFKTAITEYKKVPDKLNRFAVAQKRILYIEKNMMDIDLTINQLKTEAPNLILESARTAQEGLRILKGDNGIDLILMDLSIDDMDALTFLKEMKFIGIKKPLIIVTAHGDENKAVIAVKLGAYDYIVKRDKYLKQLPYSIFNALDKFNTDIYNEKLKEELVTVNKSLEAKVEERTRSLLEEIAERKLAEKQILKLNRVYSLLSNINQAIVRIHDSGKLFDEVCRIAIEEGKFRMAWVGLINSETNKVEVHASSGLISDYLQNINIDLAQKTRMQGPIGRAIRTGKYFLSNHISTDANMIPWREDALKLGYQSCIAFPIICNGIIRGTYTLYSDEVDFFDLEEIKLLDEMASDISFAIEFIEGEAERKKSEAALLESELRFEQITENAKEWIWEVDKDGKFTYVSPVVKELLGYEPNELVGKKYFYDLFDEKDKIELKRLALEIFERKECFKDLLNINEHKDGRKIIMSTTATPMLDGKGNLTGYRGVDIDITEREQTVLELHESEERYRSLYENTTLGLYRTTPDGRILLANPALIKILGYSSFEEISARNLEEEGFNPNYERKYFIEQIEKKGEVFGLESTWVRKDGAVVYISESARLIRDETGRTLYYDGTVEDITKRKQAEMLLRETQEKIQKIYNSSPNGISMINLDGEIVECNQATVGMVGYSSKEELLGKNGFNFVVRKDRKRAFEMIQKLLSIEETIHGIELEMQRLDGSRFTAEHAASLLQDSTGNLIGIVVITTDITERKRAEEALRESELRFRSVWEKGSDGMRITNEEGLVVLANDAFCKIVGKPHEEIEGKPMSIVYEEVKRKDVLRKHQERFRSRSIPSHLERELILWNGKKIFLELSNTFLENPHQPTLSLSIFKDITERKKTEEALLYERSLLRTLIDNIPDSIYSKDLECRKTLANIAEVHNTGAKSEAEVLGKNDFDFYPKELAEKFMADDQSVLQTGIPVLNREEFIFDEKGEKRWLLSSKLPLRNKDKQIVGLVGIGRDITERKREEEQLLKLSHAVEQSPASIIITDTAGNIEYVNPRTLAVTGYRFSELIGKNPKIFGSGETTSEQYKELWENITKGKEWRGEFQNKKKNGDLYWEQASISPIISENKITHYLAVKEDITERKKILEELILAKEKAVESDKLKSEFLAQMSHEIRTPLNAIVGNVDLMRETLSENMDEDTRVSFEGIDLASQRIIRTIDLILNVAEFQTSGYKPYFVKVDLNTEILSKLHYEHLLSAKQKGLEFIYTCKEKNSGIVADSYSLMQIFANLIDNAIKYTKEGKVEILLDRNSIGNIIVEVKDTGIGISKSFLPKLFERFVQETQGANRHYDGNGLGLSLVKNYCEINNASIEVESKKNVGSTFRVIFRK